jgi:SAM-dependent methyltransferase
MPSALTRLAARVVHATSAVDRAAQRFNQWRSRLVLAFASEAFLQAYGEAAFSRAPAYRADSNRFRQGLFDWEAAAVRNFFPAPPAHVLVGGAGGGREPFALAKMGYQVTAFDPALALVETMEARARADGLSAVRALYGGYEDLPTLPASGTIAASDLRDAAPFDAAIVGWASFSHLTNDSRRIDALRKMAALTRGPILISYFSRQADGGVSSGARSGLRGMLNRRSARWGHAMFTPTAGYARLLSTEDIEQFAGHAGLSVARVDPEANFPNAILIPSDMCPPKRA